MSSKTAQAFDAYRVSAKENAVADRYFDKVRGKDTHVFGKVAQSFFRMSKVPGKALFKIWQMSDLDGDNRLDRVEFRIAFHITAVLRKQKGKEPPAYLPKPLFPIEIVDGDADKAKSLYAMAEAGKLDRFKLALQKHKLHFNVVSNNNRKLSSKNRRSKPTEKKGKVGGTKGKEGGTVVATEKHKRNKQKQEKTLVENEEAKKDDTKNGTFQASKPRREADSSNSLESTAEDAARKIQARVRGSLVRKMSDSLGARLEESESESESDFSGEDDGSTKKAARKKPQVAKEERDDEYENDFSDDDIDNGTGSGGGGGGSGLRGRGVPAPVNTKKAKFMKANSGPMLVLVKTPLPRSGGDDYDYDDDFDDEDKGSSKDLMAHARRLGEMYEAERLERDARMRRRCLRRIVERGLF